MDHCPNCHKPAPTYPQAAPSYPQQLQPPHQSPPKDGIRSSQTLVVLTVLVAVDILVRLIEIAQI